MPLPSIMGIDPGSKGAIAVIPPCRSCVVLHRFEGKSYQEVFRLIEEIGFRENIVACLEKVHARPHDGVSSAFKFGYGSAVVEAALWANGVPYYHVIPQVWQRGVSMGGRYADRKAASRDKVKKLWPALKGVTKETADSVLLAEYGHLLFYKKGIKP